ncbi:unnamed protein product [Caenorhabditis bovis]|uniref:Uncharacterized protein n=1 Tax=Caenorhabditis bovis TaxID=2654633 RepID=A0A8S1EX69_9PELO|nr:unnamed protein product [Caenorhabditis bovis]
MISFMEYTYENGFLGGSLTYSQPQPSTQAVISAANESINDVDDINLELRTAPKKENADSINLNDILMERVINHTEDDRTEVVVEDVVSISTDVVQEINEDDLSNAIKNTHENNEGPKVLRARPAITRVYESISIHSEDDEDVDPKMSVIEFIKSEATRSKTPEVVEELVESPTTRQPAIPAGTASEISDSEEELEIPSKSPGLDMISTVSTARSNQQLDEFKELNSGDELPEIEDDGEVQQPPPPLPANPPPRLSSTNMYAHADSESDSDDEASGEAQPVNAIGLIKMQPINFANSPTGDQDNYEEDEVSEESLSSAPSPTSSSSMEKENDNRVTRISVKSDGRAEIHSPRSPITVSLDADRQITDDEFSEKLI